MSTSPWFNRQPQQDIAPIVALPSEAVWHLTPRRQSPTPFADRRRRRRLEDPNDSGDLLGLTGEVDAPETPQNAASSIISLIQDLGHDIESSELPAESDDSDEPQVYEEADEPRFVSLSDSLGRGPLSIYSSATS